MDFISFKLFSRNHFSENQIQIHPWDQLGAPGAVHPRPLTSGPACQPGPLARTQRGGDSGEPELTAGGLSRRTEGLYAFYGSRRTQRTYLRGLKRTGASSPPAMAERRRCSPPTRGVGPVERDWSGSRASRCQGEHDALTKWHRKARRHADYARGGGALAAEETRASGAHRASPNARKRVPQWRSEGRAWGSTNRRMVHALGENG